eukprot:719350-Rhodomonas_salina.2
MERRGRREETSRVDEAEVEAGGASDDGQVEPPHLPAPAPSHSPSSAPDSTPPRCNSFSTERHATTCLVSQYAMSLLI